MIISFRSLVVLSCLFAACRIARAASSESCGLHRFTSTSVSLQHEFTILYIPLQSSLILAYTTRMGIMIFTANKSDDVTYERQYSEEEGISSLSMFRPCATGKVGGHSVVVFFLPTRGMARGRACVIGPSCAGGLIQQAGAHGM